MSAAEAAKAIPDSSPPAPRYKPDWLEKPTGKDMSNFYPDHAERHDINGRATIKCQVDSHGGLANCQVMSESPQGEGFGAAAVSLSRKFRMTPPQGHVDPRPPEITIPIVFQIPDYNRRLPKSKTHAASSAADGGSFESLIAKASGSAPTTLGAMAVVVIVFLLVRNHIRARDQGRDL